MSRESANQSLRQIRTLYAHGAIGRLTDTQLVDQFLGRNGLDREDAFAALVQRHGPMVLSVCRRMLCESADADDAFQAVFLVLARKAGAVRRVDGLKSWLYGVAVRTAKEARRRSARRRAKEGGTTDESTAVSSPEEGRDEWLALLDEEIDRLPSRFRDPLMLCELEGASRQDAARQLGLAEGTLSSRLARGRVLLRERLARRGVGHGAGIFPALVSAPGVPEPLAASTVRLALKFAAGGAAAGAVPATVASLAERVLAMITLAKLRLILVTVTLGAMACTTAGLAWAVVPIPGAQALDNKPAAAMTKSADVVKKPTSKPGQVSGIVVDEAGKPVSGTEVLVGAHTDREAQGITDGDGLFAIPFRRPSYDGTVLHARSADSKRVGFFRYGYNLTMEAAETPARIVLKRGKEITVRVTDASSVPVPEAAVNVAGNHVVFAHATTSLDGSARLRVPTDATVEWVIALKSGKGFDYAEYGMIDEQGRTKGGVPAADLPTSVALTLDGVRKVQIKAVDRDDKPVAGVGFYPWLLRKEGRRSDVNYFSRILIEKTGPDGVVTFDWLPPSKKGLQFWPVQEGYARRRVTIEEDKTGPVVVKLTRSEAIRGRVVLPDGSPAAGIEVQARGSGKGLDNGMGRVRTNADGSYEMQVNVEEAYVVFIEDTVWAAPSRLDVILREGKPVDGVDFKLGRGTLLHGKVTVGPANKPAPKVYIRLDESGEPAPEEFREKGDTFGHQVRRQFGSTTDAEGHYSIRVGPGTYTVMGPPRTTDEKVTIKEEAELVRDFKMPRPENGTLTGRVVLAGAGDKGIAGAKVEVAAANMLAIPFAVTTDADGRFQAERALDRLVICAKSPDGTLGAIVEVGAEDPDVIIPIRPTSSATGLLLDEAGKPAANQKLDWGRRVFIDEEQQISMTCFAPKVVTDGEGRFTLPSLVVGQKYGIAVQRGNVYKSAGMVRPDAPEPIDLGTLTIGAYKPPADPNDVTQSSFRKDAPGAGKDAPPIEATTLDGKPLKLDELKGKYVLLDFWATWCGPCIAEIPKLQEIHDTFGKDDRFAILSLSVDDKIEEPRKFQDKRKLPWSQAFLGGGIQGPFPDAFGVRAIPAFVLVGPDGRIVARGMRGDDIKKEVAKALAKP